MLLQVVRIRSLTKILSEGQSVTIFWGGWNVTIFLRLFFTNVFTIRRFRREHISVRRSAFTFCLSAVVLFGWRANCPISGGEWCLRLNVQLKSPRTNRLCLAEGRIFSSIYSCRWEYNAVLLWLTSEVGAESIGE